MALSETNIIKLSQIFGVIYLDVNAQISWMGSRFTSAVQTEIEAQIALWDAGAGDNFTSIEPNIKNFGARINPENTRQAIRSAIAVLLERPDWADSGSTITSRYQRG